MCLLVVLWHKKAAVFSKVKDTLPMQLVGCVHIFWTCFNNLESFFVEHSGYGFWLCLLIHCNTCLGLWLGFSSRYFLSCTRRHLYTFESSGISISHLISRGMIFEYCTPKQRDTFSLLMHFLSSLIIFPNLLVLQEVTGWGFANAANQVRLSVCARDNVRHTFQFVGVSKFYRFFLLV